MQIDLPCQRGSDLHPVLRRRVYKIHSFIDTHRLGKPDLILQIVVFGESCHPVTYKDGNAIADHVSQGQLLDTYNNFLFGLP
jgi:hypothetical protein